MNAREVLMAIGGFLLFVVFFAVAGMLGVIVLGLSFAGFVAVAEETRKKGWSAFLKSMRWPGLSEVPWLLAVLWAVGLFALRLLDLLGRGSAYYILFQWVFIFIFCMLPIVFTLLFLSFARTEKVTK